MLKTFGAALSLASVLAFGVSSASALEVVETQVQKNANGTTTYHFAIKTDPGETLTPGEDFVTVYNFYGLVRGSEKSPTGWSISSQEFGQTPTWMGYPAVRPMDIAGAPNLTWTPSSQIDGGTQIDGFAATTRMVGNTTGSYSAQVTRDAPAVDGSGSAKSKQALVGELMMPRFLAK